MKLTYFVSPYDLLDVENKTCRALRTDALGSTGLSATVTMESSSAHKLQISTLISINKNLTGKRFGLIRIISQSIYNLVSSY